MAQITTTLRRLFNELNDAERRLLGQRIEQGCGAEPPQLLVAGGGGGFGLAPTVTRHSGAALQVRADSGWTAEDRAARVCLQSGPA
jgi:hypothetical protein